MQIAQQQGGNSMQDKLQPQLHAAQVELKHLQQEHTSLAAYLDALTERLGVAVDPGSSPASALQQLGEAFDMLLCSTAAAVTALLPGPQQTGGGSSCGWIQQRTDLDAAVRRSNMKHSQLQADKAHLLYGMKSSLSMLKTDLDQQPTGGSAGEAAGEAAGDSGDSPQGTAQREAAPPTDWCSSSVLEAVLEFEAVIAAMRQQNTTLQAQLQQEQQAHSSTAATKDAELATLQAQLQQEQQAHSSSIAAKDTELATLQAQLQQEQQAHSSTAATKDAELATLQAQLQQEQQAHSSSIAAKDTELATLQAQLQHESQEHADFLADAKVMRTAVAAAVQRWDPFEPTGDSVSYAGLAKVLESAQQDSSKEAAKVAQCLAAEKEKLQQANMAYEALSCSAGKVLAAANGAGPSTAADRSAAVVSTEELDRAAAVVRAFQTAVQSAATSLGSSKEAAAGSSCSQLPSLLEAGVQQHLTLCRMVEHASACLDKLEWVDPAVMAGNSSSSQSSSSSTAVKLAAKLSGVTESTIFYTDFLQLERNELDAKLQKLRTQFVNTQLPAYCSISGDNEGTADTAGSSLQGNEEGSFATEDQGAASSRGGSSLGAREGSGTGGGHCQDAACQGSRDQQQRHYDPVQALHGNGGGKGEMLGEDPPTEGPVSRAEAFMLPAPPKAADELEKLKPFVKRVVGLTAYEDQDGLPYAQDKVAQEFNTLLQTAVADLQQQRVPAEELKQILQDGSVAEFMQCTRVLLLRGQLRRVEQQTLLQQHRASVMQRRTGGGHA
jgi:hypothetical protein